jgi:hypothetical protein
MTRQLLTLVALTLAGCSAITSVYQQPGYSAQGPAPIKRIVVAAWAPPSAPGLGALVAPVAPAPIKRGEKNLV